MAFGETSAVGWTNVASRAKVRMLSESFAAVSLSPVSSIVTERVSVVAVVLNWNGAEDTLRCLESLSRQTLKPTRTVVVDNGSTDDSVARIRAWSEGKSNVVMIASPDNLGFAAGSNLGIRLAMKSGAEYVLLLNNDTVVEPDALDHLVGFMTSHPDYAACTGQIRYMDRPVIWNCGGDLTWFGSRRYLYSEQPASAAPSDGWAGGIDWLPFPRLGPWRLRLRGR